VLPFGTRLDVRLTESIEADAIVSGKTFQAELIRPVVVRGEVIVPDGTLAEGRVSESREPGYGGESYDALSLELTALVYDGQRIPVRTNEVTRPLSTSRRDRALDTLGRAGRELGTILGGQVGGTAGRTTDETIDIAKQGEIPRGTRFVFLIEDEVRPQVVETDRFSE
jgi:hypothetical protein